jgi:uncharacterized membrane protein
MKKGRLEAFSDGVIAIIITIMVLELKVPQETSFTALQSLLPKFFSYVLSFIYVGIYWNNHHHLLQATQFVNGSVLWANLHLLFWLSLFPFATAWMGENQFAPFPVAVYGVVLLLAAIAYLILTRALLRSHGKDSTLAVAVGRDLKGKISVVLYFSSIFLTLVSPWLSCIIYVSVAAMWLVPDRRIEKALTELTR